MSVDTVRRRGRRVALPAPPTGEIGLQSPPVLPRGSGQGGMQLLFMLPMMLGMGAMSFVYIGRSGGVMTYLFGALYAGAMIGMLVMSFSRGGMAKKAQINNERRDYLRYLAGLRGQVHKVATAQTAAALAGAPDPADLWTIVDTERLWERGRDDADFCRVRIGTGPQRLATPLRAPQTAPLEDLDPLCSTSLRHFIRAYATVPGLPVAISLRAFHSVLLSGDRAESLDLARSLLAELAVFHAPDDLRIAIAAPTDRWSDWAWTKWLPHTHAAGAADAAGPVRLCADDPARLAELLGADLGERPAFGHRSANELPHVLLVVDDATAAAAPFDGALGGVTVLRVGAPLDEEAPSIPGVLRLLLTDGRVGMVTDDGVAFAGDADHLDAASAEALARLLTRRHVGTPVRDDLPLSATFGLADLIGIGDPRRLDPAVTWSSRTAGNRLRIPLGIDPDGRPVELDLKESAENGMGPHGLVIGATGSGKSELLRTLVSGLAVTHSSETLNLALIDFKGGATFAGMSGLPHTCAVITNLADELPLVDRMADALRGELVRRQELLRAAGNFASVRDYERARAGGADLKPLPSLLVIIDEFSELLHDRPEFIDLFVMIGRLGRSLGIHLLLASQRLEEGRLRGLDSHLSYRIGLRTFSASESRAVLGVPDAYELPPVPGSAYLKVDTATLIRFKAAYVSGELPPLDGGDAHTGPAPVHRALPFTLARVPEPEALPAPDTGPRHAAPTGAAPAGETILDAMVAALVGKGPAAHQIWLPPLAEPPSMDGLLPPLSVDPERGLCPAGWAGNGRLTVPVAIVDKPFEQRRDLLWADLSGQAGNAIVVGAPQAGKSTLLRSLLTALALTHTPAEVQFFVLDFGGGALAAMAGLPHVSGAAARVDVERCRRIVAELTALLAEREALFAEHRIDSMASFRRRRGELRGADGREFGDVFLFVDGWMTLRQEYEPLEQQITTLAARGLGFGIHVVLSANRWMEVRPQLRDVIGTRFELRLGDPSDSGIDRRAAENVPKAAPGRGLTAEKLHFLTALPRLDGKSTVDDLTDGAADLVARVRAAWPGEPAPPVRLLPRRFGIDVLPAPASLPGRTIPIGVGESDLGPVGIDLSAEPHFVLFGDTESGKSNLLRLIGRGITERYTPAEAAVLVVDYRHGLLDAVGGDHLMSYAAAEPTLAGVVGEVQQAMQARLPGPDVRPEQLRDRSWWSGPDLFVLVDDYDLVAVSGRNPLAPLLEFVPLARDIGLHLILARHAGGASKALYEPIMGRIRELGSPGLLLSGAKDEGVILGDVKMSAQPPGRGTLVRRRFAPELIQLALLDG
ncbi:type VII secretion protein EccC [Actinocatenispora thailandica]|uniref:Type VII secretion protein EccC n=1 Tax=Actinocatenispora thailandica TaxID=227318 RepID=A0A7R7DKX7_9ACTN|nr:type VII secretion protein EccCa [Actinocatenispora thailandica]BCJ33625.1 type VII secretion protein EccC [Actinocatenispora thailandica]